ncbi:MAG: SDR family NAD(P)-dependent oxidoreductase [Nitrospiraceae bacterium]
MTAQDFSGRRIWVTGASSGIGRATALELARRGGTVIASARSYEALDALVREGPAGRLAALALDVTNRQATQQTASLIEQRFGGLDIAFFNAGTCEYVDVKRFDSALVERVIRTNLLSLVYGIEAVLPLLRRSAHPHLVGMSSTVAYGGLPRAEAYGTSKAAIYYLLQSLRLDLAPEQIPVSIVCPGFVRTPLTDVNDFPMPFRIEAEDAACRIADGIAAQKQEIHFPQRFSIPFKLLAMLPGFLYNRLAGQLVRPT